MMRILIACLLICVLFVACEKESKNSEPFHPDMFLSTGKYAGEYYPTDNWRKCSPAEVGMDTAKLMAMNRKINDYIKNEGIAIHSLLIVKDGYIVVEGYGYDFNENDLHIIHSCTKSITSALTGIALQKKLIASIDTSVVNYFSDRDIQNLNDWKRKITLRNLLSMSDGMEWNEHNLPYGDPENSYKQWMKSKDRIQFVLDRPMRVSPGSRFNYNSGGTYVLSAIIQKATGKRLDVFAEEEIFSRIGIRDTRWEIDNLNIARGDGWVYMRPRDMARFGYLYLKKGKWEDQQIIPESWIGKSVKKENPSDPYGYLFWLYSDSQYAAMGYEGQWIYMIPNHNLVVVFTNKFKEGNMYEWNIPASLINDYIIKSVY